jgi:2-C-methyl-D-erythritol 4-phosphate cytidylyltransferase
MRIHAILLAGGSGDRFGAEAPKQFVRLAGEQILVRSMRTVAGAGVDHLVVVAHPDWVDETRSVLASSGLSVPATVVAGGKTRNESTRNGLLSLDADDDDVIVVHDASCAGSRASGCSWSAIISCCCSCSTCSSRP